MRAVGRRAGEWLGACGWELGVGRREPARQSVGRRGGTEVCELEGAVIVRFVHSGLENLRHRVRASVRGTNGCLGVSREKKLGVSRVRERLAAAPALTLRAAELGPRVVIKIAAQAKRLRAHGGKVLNGVRIISIESTHHPGATSVPLRYNLFVPQPLDSNTADRLSAAQISLAIMPSKCLSLDSQPLT